MRRSILSLSILGLLGILAFTPKAADPIDDLIVAFQKWTDANPQEKVYLHMDKPYYAIGDTLWFKAYVTIGGRHQLSKLSGALYVELIDEKDSLLSSLKLPVIAGMAMGDFALADEYHQGNFRIRAYTQWMRNAGEDYFFDKSFVVEDPSSLPANVAAQDKKSKGRNATDQNGSAKPTPSGPVDVQFFPEGGNLVAGIGSRIGFKAVGPNGLGLPVKGVVLDGTGKEVSSLESLHAGMGVFNLLPENGNSYKAKLRFGDGTEKTVELPKVLEEGYTLSVYQPSEDSVLVRINATQMLYQLSPAVSLMVQSGGEQVYASRVRITKAVNSVWLLKKDFPSGIAQFTIFDYTGQPLNERIAFIRGDDRMKLEVKTSKSVYKSHERVDLELLARDKMGRATAGNFSVSVIDESKVPSDENTETTILSSLMLSSDIKGYIEQPNYYFYKDTSVVNKALDNLMLTQGYRRFSWKDISGKEVTTRAPQYKAESLGTEISGKVLTLSGKPVVNGTVTVMSLNPGFMEQAKTNAEGGFAYAPIMLADSLRFAVQAVTDKNSKKVQVLLDVLPAQPIGKNWNIPGFNQNMSKNALLLPENDQKQIELLAHSGRLNRVNRLKEVQIKAKQLAAETKISQGAFAIPEGSVDQVFMMKGAGSCPALVNCIQGSLHGVIFKPLNDIPSYPYARDPRSDKVDPLPMQVIVNGTRLDEQEVADILFNNTVDPADVLKIDVVISNNAMVMVLGKPTLLIYVKKPYIRNAKYTPNMVNIKPKGFNHVREFYAPRYDRPGLNNQLPDLRTTVYWNPRVKTLESGKANLSFFNADGTGTYKIVVEGINAAGELARAVYRYRVEGDAALTTADLPSSGATDLASAMQELQQRMPAERLYLHTDKPYYNLGDTLWFKAYLFDAATLTASKRSGLLYVELNDDTAEAVRRISIPIKNGIGYAQIPLIRKIFHEGGYTLRAYTNWMQNFGADYFFTKRFYLGLPNRDTWLVRSSAKIRKVMDKDQLEADILLSRSYESYVGLRDVEVTIMEGDRRRFRENLRTSTEGKLDIRYELPANADGRNIRVEVRSLNQNDGNQRLLIPLNIRRNQLIDLQFLPEGGNLVSGLKSTVGFKAVAEDGKGIDITGEILDSKGIMVKEFFSLYKGMGSFEFSPIAGEQYTARIKQPEATAAVYKLPLAQSNGTVLHVVNEEGKDSLKVEVLSGTAALHADSSYFLTALSRGVVTYIKMLNPQKMRMVIAKKQFPGGITRISLLQNKTVLNERLIFIDHHDGLDVRVNADKTSYYKRDSVRVLLEVKDKSGNPIAGNFSLSVTDDSQVKADSAGHMGIGAALFSAELRGTVETPGYYLYGKDKDRWQALNNLLLTQGWVGYDWKAAFSTPVSPAFEAEKYFKVTGMVTNILNKPVAGAQLLISSQKPFFIHSSLSDEKGRYIFENLPQIDSGSFFIQAKTPKGGKMSFGEVTVDRFKPAQVPETFRDAVLPWYVNTDVRQLNYVKNIFSGQSADLKGDGILLREVKVSSKKIIKDSFNPMGPGIADMIFDEKDIKESAVLDLYELLRQKLPGLKAVNDHVYNNHKAILKWNKFNIVPRLDIYIDGWVIDNAMRIIDPLSVPEMIDELKNFKIEGFKGLEVLYSRKYTNRFYMVKGLNFRKEEDFAALFITTTSKRGWYRINNADRVTYRPQPVMRPLLFYSPKYTMSERGKGGQDFRSTIYWKPDLLTDASGKASVTFYTADVSGSYTLDLQGADMDGKTGSGSLKIKVINQEP